MAGDVTDPANYQAIEQLLDTPDGVSLGAEKRELTFLFTDIAGFTSMTEATEPAQVGELLNEYFDLTGAVVLRHGGTIDKIVGDALHVMFNAPIDQPDHAERAVRCAVEVHRHCYGGVEAEPTPWHDYDWSVSLTVPPLGVVFLTPA